jgi:hypothetical protein
VTSHATASVLSVADDSIVTDMLAERADAEAEAVERHYLIMIESMVRDGYSESEIAERIRALRRQ